MSLDVTVGGTNAESYASVAEADAYLAFRGDTSSWTALGTTDKELKLKWATSILQDLTWRGTIASTTQALNWPRWGVIDKDGFPILDTIIPKELKLAQAELAFQQIANDWTQGLGPTVPARVKVGSIEIENQTVKGLPQAVIAKIRHLLASVPGQGTLVRG